MQFSIASIFVLLSCLATAAEFQNMFLLFFRVVFLLGIIYSFASSNKIHKESKDNFTGEERSFESNKRDILFGFRPMIECATRRSAWDFLGYGCWCGKGGRGTPVDGVDRCCKAHDICYDNLSSVCPHKIMNYIMPYSTRSCTSCEPASYYWFWGSCRHNLCTCDATAARCFAQHSFNEDFKSYTKSKC